MPSQLLTAQPEKLTLKRSVWPPAKPGGILPGAAVAQAEKLWANHSCHGDDFRNVLDNFNIEFGDHGDKELTPEEPANDTGVGEEPPTKKARSAILVP